MPGEALLSVERVSKRFAGVQAVDAASFTVARGSITALIGPNGAGKSTLFNVVTGFERGDGGEVRLDGRSVYGSSPHSIARKGMVRTFQLTKALSVMSVLDNMLLAAPNNPGERLAALRPAAGVAVGRAERSRARARDARRVRPRRQGPATMPARFRAGSASCSSSLGRSCSSPGSSSSTSRSQASTRRWAECCSSTSRPCGPSAA